MNRFEIPPPPLRASVFLLSKYHPKLEEGGGQKKKSRKIYLNQDFHDNFIETFSLLSKNKLSFILPTYISNNNGKKVYVENCFFMGGA